MKTSLRIVVILVLSNCPVISTAVGCGTEVAERVALPNSQWVVETQVLRCSAIDPGELRIFGENLQTKQQVDVLILNGEADSHVEYIGSSEVRISIPNFVAIKKQTFSVGPYKVSYRYLPHDDPEARSKFEAWVRSPNDPTNKKWYEENILNKIQPANRSSAH